MSAKGPLSIIIFCNENIYLYFIPFSADWMKSASEPELKDTNIDLRIQTHQADPASWPTEQVESAAERSKLNIE